MDAIATSTRTSALSSVDIAPPDWFSKAAVIWKHKPPSRLTIGWILGWFAWKDRLFHLQTNKNMMALIKYAEVLNH
jgi:hypothetical protein